MKRLLTELFRQTNPAAANQAYPGPDPEQFAVLLIDPGGDRILYATHRAGSLTGYDRDELFSMSCSDLFGENGRAILTNIHGRMTTTGPGMVWGQDVTVLKKDGGRKRFFCTLRIPPDMETAGEYSLSLIVALDPGELGPNQTMVPTGPNPRFVMEALQNYLFEFDVKQNVFFYSKYYRHIYGDDGINGNKGYRLQDWLAAAHPDDADTILLKWRQLLKEGQRYRINYRIRNQNDEWSWITCGIHAIMNDSQGRPHRILGFHLDITSAIETDKCITDTGERLRTIFNNVVVGIGVCNTEGIVTQANAALAFTLGHNREYYVGRRITAFAHPEDREEIEHNLRRLSRGGRREHMLDKRFIHADGRTVWVNVTATLSAKVLRGERYLVVMLDDVSKSRSEREKLQYEATHDIMTGGWNRWVLLERLEQHIHIAQRHKLSMAFCICDLDYFKRVNDMFGHLTGDKVLIRFVQVLREAVRETEVVGRYGGEEFAIVFPSTTVQGARRAMDRARANLQQETFCDDNDVPFQVSATFGISGVTRDSNARQVVSWADAALYQGKSDGRNRVVVADPPEGQEWL